MRKRKTQSKIFHDLKFEIEKELPQKEKTIIFLYGFFIGGIFWLWFVLFGVWHFL